MKMQMSERAKIINDDDNQEETHLKLDVQQGSMRK